MNFGFKYEKIATLKYSNSVFKGSIYKYNKRIKMHILTMEYKYIVFLKLLKKNEKLEDACSKAGLTIKEASTLINMVL
ncbi:hypothetical protein AEBR_0469 [Halarcobacter ebronensis]|uniref:Uncharacterized protein n=1 Tax=Halarcobacter ebronensis TaxID=1462615 RepID=A0A4Q1AVR9_9BACT|nr:hypothetical protein AEBR_0469 [Halarcobacter ebronensis]RXK06294.1 hypothetical protein CRV07_06235 [Halarcobacter ebronensis]